MKGSSGRRGAFITLEGPDGAGKSTQSTRLADTLRAAGHDVTLTREPGGTPLGERIRAVLLAATEEPGDAAADALLFNAARAELVRTVIRPALEDGGVVICDRFADSTIAYQGHGSGLDVEALRALEAFATGGLRPDRIILLDLPAGSGLGRRAAGAAEELTRFESSSRHDAAFHDRVREGYLAMAQDDPARWRIVNATKGPDAVAEDIRALVQDILPTSEPPSRLVRTTA